MQKKPLGKIRVVHLVEDLKMGGQERVVEDIVTHLNHQKFSLSVLCLSAGGQIEERMRQNGIKTEILGVKNYHSLFTLRTLCRWLITNKIDIVHTHGIPAGVLGRLAAHLAGVKGIVCHMHSTCYELLPKHKVKEHFLSYLTHKIICVSAAVTESVRTDVKPAENKLLTLYNGIRIPDETAIPAITEIKKKLPDMGSNKILIAIGALKEHKGHEFLLRALAQIPKVHLLIVGEGPLLHTLEERCSELEIVNRVSFLGVRQDVFQLLKIANGLILPSLREGHPITLLEAMGMRVPIVASDVGGVSELIENGLSGRLVPPAEPHLLKNAIISLLEEPAENQIMAERAYQRFNQTATLSIMLTRLEGLYTHLVR